jgi:hypothetical protein
METLLILGLGFLAARAYFAPPLPKNRTKDQHNFDPRDPKRRGGFSVKDNNTDLEKGFIRDKEYAQGDVDEDMENWRFDLYRYAKYPSIPTVSTRNYNK